MGGRSAKVKGSTFEREVVNDLKEMGCNAQRIPLSGALKGDYAGDIRFGKQLGLLGECKRRKRAWADLYQAIAQDSSDVVFIRSDNQKTLAVMPMETLESFLKWSGQLERQD